MTRVIIHTDGACSGNPGPGGWASAVVDTDGAEVILRGGHPETTNNAMEMSAALHGLREAARSFGSGIAAGAEVLLRSDSQYVLKGLTEWLPEWKRRGWRTSSGSAVKNRDLWEALDESVIALKALGGVFATEHVKGHRGDAWNERMDRLAVSAADLSRRETGPWSETSRGTGSAAPDAPRGLDEVAAFRGALETRGYRFFAQGKTGGAFEKGLLQKKVTDDAGTRYFLDVFMYAFPVREGGGGFAAEMSVQFHTRDDMEGRFVNVTTPVTIETLDEVEEEIARMHEVMGYGLYEARTTPEPGTD